MQAPLSKELNIALPSTRTVNSPYDKFDLLPKRVARTTATLPQTAQAAIFTVSGEVLVTGIYGTVTTEIGAGANNLDIWSNPTVGADVALCAVADIDADAVGTLYTITGTPANALVPTTSGAQLAQASAVRVTAGTIDLKTSASKAGSVKWVVTYIPLEAGATIVTA